MNLISTRDGSIRGPTLPRTRRVPWRRWIAAVLLTSLAAVAFLVWGPIGLGGGPLVVYAPSGGQILGDQDQAWGMLVPVQAGNSGAVIDQVSVAGGDGYSGPRVLSIRKVADRPGQCGGTLPWQGRQSILSSCAIGGLHRLIGIALPADNSGVDMVIKVGAPGDPGGCWTAIDFVVRYHVGIRHYTVTIPDNFAACKTPAEEQSADQAMGQPG
jgi:hypothetical protein